MIVRTIGNMLQIQLLKLERLAVDVGTPILRRRIYILGWHGKTHQGSIQASH